MTALTKEYATRNGILSHVFGIPLFVFGMLLLFSPTSFDRFSIDFSRYSFHVTMILCIVLVVFAVVVLGNQSKEFNNSMVAKHPALYY